MTQPTARGLRWAGEAPGTGRLTPGSSVPDPRADRAAPAPDHALRPAPMARLEQLDERVHPDLPGTRLRQAREWTMFAHQCAPPMVHIPAPPPGTVALGPPPPSGLPAVDEHGRVLVLVPDGSHGDVWRCDCDALWSFVQTGRRRHRLSRARWAGTGWVPASRTTRARYWRAR